MNIVNGFNKYQEHAGKTAIYPGRETYSGLLYTSLGLAGEAGEFSNKIAKTLRDAHGEVHPEARSALIGELGDLLWFMSQVCVELGVSLQEVAQLNLEKLADRQQRNLLGGSGDDR